MSKDWDLHFPHEECMYVYSLNVDVCSLFSKVSILTSTRYCFWNLIQLHVLKMVIKQVVQLKNSNVRSRNARSSHNKSLTWKIEAFIQFFKKNCPRCWLVLAMRLKQVISVISIRDTCETILHMTIVKQTEAKYFFTKKNPY